MKITKTSIKDLLIIEPQIFEDRRGYFFESYSQLKFNKEGIDIHFVQDNESKSNYGIVRGLHYQLEPKAQTKLVRVISGKIYDVAVDIRKGSSTYGKWFGIELSDENKKQLLIPKGFAHGFSVLSGNATVLYKCDEFYAPEYDSGIIYNDPDLKIDWQIPDDKIVISEKDSRLPAFDNAKNNFKY
jgi:dTDP-4-dehydrorhamnose 3,5-epimerase